MHYSAKIIIKMQFYVEFCIHALGLLNSFNSHLIVFSLTHLIYSVIHDHSCKILYMYITDVLPDDSTDEERQNYQSNLKELDQFLGPYPYDK